MNDEKRILIDRARLEALRELALLHPKQPVLYDRITQLACEVLGTPVSLLTMVAADHQFFTSQVGLPEPWATQSRTPLSHSFCKHVVGTNIPLIIADARLNPLLQNNLAIPDLNVVAYLGMPITLDNGLRLGAFCAIDDAPRHWTLTEIDIVRELSRVITHELNLRALALADPTYRSVHARVEADITTLVNHIDRSLPPEHFLKALRAELPRVFRGTETLVE